MNSTHIGRNMHRKRENSAKSEKVGMSALVSLQLHLPRALLVVFQQDTSGETWSVCDGKERPTEAPDHRVTEDPWLTVRPASHPSVLSHCPQSQQHQQQNLMLTQQPLLSFLHWTHQSINQSINQVSINATPLNKVS